VEDVSYVGNTG